MATIKTAISLQPAVFKEADALARRLRVPRSKLVALALEDYIEQHRNRNLLRQINTAYAKGLDRNERKTLERMKAHFFESVKDPW